MNKAFKFILPSPNFNKISKDASKPKPHFLTPSGMSLLPREKQPPPMYGKHGATVPARYLTQQPCDNRQQQTVKNPAEKQYCELCELEFQAVDDLKRHRSQHEKCPVAGCNYKGHPSVMDKHINALHSSGLFEKFKKLSTPEEIAAWREDRRKRYPTLANVLLKQKAQAQRQKRGERLEASKSRFGKINDRKRAHPNTTQDKNQNEAKRPKEDKHMNNKNKRNRKNNRKQNTRNQNNALGQNIDSKKYIEKNQVQEDANPIRWNIKMFAGTSQLKDYKHFNEKKSTNNNVLFSLVGMYGSDDDEDEIETDEDYYKLNNETKLEEISLEEVEKSSDMESIENKMTSTSFNEIQVENTKSTNEDFQLSIEPEQKPTDDIKNEEISHVNLSSNNSSFSEIKTPEPTLTHQLGNLNSSASSYVNADNSSDEGPEEAPIQKNSTDLPFASEATLNPVSKIEHQVKPSKLEEHTATLRQRHLVKRKYGLDYRKARLRKQNTMLEKLLEVDIRHERNVLLQCVRYVCENNFFGIGQYKPG